jgi:uncharacterized protein YndB with AHSA1/START domain
MIIQSSVQIAASVERVWSLLTEPEQQKKWMRGLVANRLVDSEASHVGAKIEIVTRRKKTLTTYDGIMTHYDPPHELGIRFTNGKIKRGYSVSIRYWISPKNGETILKYRAETVAEKTSIFTSMKLLLLKMQYLRTAKLRLKMLKALAEGTDPIRR